MIATVNVPGSSHFAYFRGTRRECQRWLADMEIEYKEQFGGTWWNAYAPARLITEREARQWKYRDGSRVIREFSLSNASGVYW